MFIIIKHHRQNMIPYQAIALGVVAQPFFSCLATSAIKSLAIHSEQFYPLHSTINGPQPQQ